MFLSRVTRDEVREEKKKNKKKENVHIHRVFLFASGRVKATLRSVFRRSNETAPTEPFLHIAWVLINLKCMETLNKLIKLSSVTEIVSDTLKLTKIVGNHKVFYHVSTNKGNI